MLKLMRSRSNTAIIYDDDKDFGEVEVVNTSPPVSELLPNQKIDPDKLKHLSDQHKKELLAVFDKYPESVKVFF